MFAVSSRRVLPGFTLSLGTSLLFVCLILLLPLSALTGSVFLVWADVAARTILPRTEVPIGILISVVGAPFFIFLMVRKNYSFGGRA